LNKFAGVVQWQNGSFPSCIRGFDSLRPLQHLWWQSLRRRQELQGALKSGDPAKGCPDDIFLKTKNFEIKFLLETKKEVAP
jgi:hypothetical protein